MTTEARRHDWAPDVKNGAPVLGCARAGCWLVWWPDRREPKAACTGRDVDVAAQGPAFVRALMIGGGAQ